MITRAFILALLLSTVFSRGQALKLGLQDGDSIRYHDAQTLSVIGRYHQEASLVRFPKEFEKSLRKNVWELGKNTAGMGIRFRTNASTIVIRWTVLNNASLPHMPSTGVKGVDLYAYVGEKWQYVHTGFPKGKVNEATLLQAGVGITREYLLNLPLYDGVESLQIGVNASSELSLPKDRHLLNRKPVVYYGTSIAQGGCASRPGLAFTSIISRDLNVPFINLGFSGNGTIETSVGEAMIATDAALYVIDCNPNTAVDLIYERTMSLVGMLKKTRPNVPILLVGGFLNESNRMNEASEANETIRKKDAELKRAFRDLQKTGVTGIYYREGFGLIGDDHEGTVDGIHPNDIGMLRIAKALSPVIRKLL